MPVLRCAIRTRALWKPLQKEATPPVLNDRSPVALHPNHPAAAGISTFLVVVTHAVPHAVTCILDNGSEREEGHGTSKSHHILRFDVAIKACNEDLCQASKLVPHEYEAMAVLGEYMSAFSVLELEVWVLFESMHAPAHQS